MTFPPGPPPAGPPPTGAGPGEPPEEPPPPGMPPPPGGAHPPPGMPAGGDQGNGLAITGMVLGIVSIPALCIPVVNLVMGPLAIIFSALGLKRAPVVYKGKGMAIAGLVLGIIATVFVILGLIGLVTFDSDIGDWDY
ncbi:DUF4190 domain-containing protein [Natronoglycomyces albus]|uniref:DUF4190 domain-containing protein n=1 Tax=Natronoglycomyces albus TaxID=2811108 RepID=A0A895XKC9_9ACTN|nr:DUF4190 domain-containing protein [Natronoglycomyces albus]QSB05794.1 DUF4190 domain-containing protein [Natronoglycomyces albus]